MQEFYQLKPSTIVNYLRREEAYYWFLCLYLVLEYVRPQTIWPQLEFFPFVQISIILTWALYLLAKRKDRQGNTINILMLAFVFVVFASSVLSYFPQESFQKLKLILSWIIIYFLIVKITNTEKRLFVLLVLYLLVNLKMAQHGFRTWLAAGFGFSSWGVTCAPGWFQNSGECGAEMAIFVPMSICFMLALWKRWSISKRGIFLIFPIFGSATVIASSSRGAVLALVASLIWLSVANKLKPRAVVFLMFSALVGYLIMPDQFKNRFSEIGEDQTSIQRVIYWNRGIDILRSHPFLGIGYNNWLRYFEENFPEDGYFDGVSRRAQVPHNIFIEVGAELGGFGLLVFFSLIYANFLNNYRTRSLTKTAENKFLFWTAIGLDAALLSFLVSGFFVTITYYPFFWIISALTAATNNIAKKELRKSRDTENHVKEV